jgi:lysophospholipase L1-like esterase
VNALSRARVAPRASITIAILCGLALAAYSQPLSPSEHWVGTWATAPVPRPQAQPPAAGAAPPAQPPLNPANTTLRQIVHVSLGGKRARVVFSNAFGASPLSIGAASVALRDKESSVIAGSSRPLKFAGQAPVMIPAGGLMISDPVDIAVPTMGDLVIDVFLPAEMIGATSQFTIHAGANQTNYVSKPGNFAGSADFPVATTPGSTPASWYFLSRVEVVAPASVSAIIAFGDSITDGTASTRNTNNRWPDLFIKRLSEVKGSNIRAMINEAIAGNRLLSDGILNFGVNALARFDRDVLAQPGATHVVVLEGINDIGMGRAGPAPTGAELIAAHQQLIDRAHQHGLKIIGATLTPFEGAAYFTPDGEIKRQTINSWMRAGKGESSYDAIIDFDVATRDPQNPTKFNPKYDSGDHLHPNDAGYQAMAASIDVKLFEGARGKR